MAHSWDVSPAASERPADDRPAGLRGSFRLPSGMAIGVPLRLLAVAALFLGVCGGLAARSAPDAAPPPRLAAATTPPPAPAPLADAKVPGPRASIQTSPNSLISPVSTLGLAPVQMLRPDPATICGILDVGTDAARWGESPVFAGEWECLSEGETPVPAKAGDPQVPSKGAKAKPPSVAVFTMARGAREGLVSYIRMKVSALDEAGASAGAEALADRVTRLFEAMKWPLPERVALSMRMLHPFETEEGGTKIRFVKELMGDARYNLILTFPREDTKLLNDDFRELLVLSRPSGRF